MSTDSKRVRFPWRLAIGGATITAISCLVLSPKAEADADKAVAQVKAADLLKKIEIIGALGKPLGTLVRVRGEWRDLGPLKGEHTEFSISEIDGQAIKEPVRMLLSQVQPIFRNGELVQAKGTKNWTWKANRRLKPDDPCPLVGVGEEWDLTVVESGQMKGYPKEVWKRIPGDRAPQMPAGLHDFEFQTNLKIVEATRVEAKAKETFQIKWDGSSVLKP